MILTFILNLVVTASVHASSSQILTQVSEEISVLAQTGQNPAVLFDLDDTLINSKPRMWQIFQALSNEDFVVKNFPEEAEVIAKITLKEIAYDPIETLQHLGIQNAQLLKFAREYYNARYFTSAYLVYDKAFSGAAQYVRKIIKNGGHVFYITGRNEPHMGSGTRESLKKLGFPLNEKTTLILKPDPSKDDAEFKKEVFQKILETDFTITAGFENEPRNLNLMADVFKNALLIFMDSIHSPKPDRPVPNAYWIQSWKEKKFMEFREPMFSWKL